MAITVSGVFGASASIATSNLVIPKANLPVLSSSDTDSDGAEVVFAILEKMVNSPVPLSSGNITATSSTSLTGSNQLRKTYTFTMTVGDIALSGLNVV